MPPLHPSKAVLEYPTADPGPTGPDAVPHPVRSRSRFRAGERTSPRASGGRHARSLCADAPGRPGRPASRRGCDGARARRAGVVGGRHMRVHPC